MVDGNDLVIWTLVHTTRQETETVLLVSVWRTVSMVGFDKVWSQVVAYDMMKQEVDHPEEHCFRLVLTVAAIMGGQQTRHRNRNRKLYCLMPVGFQWVSNQFSQLTAACTA
jgi:hypothetical protein